MISQIIDGGAIEVDGGASAPVDPTVATPLHAWLTAISRIELVQIWCKSCCSKSDLIIENGKLFQSQIVNGEAINLYESEFYDRRGCDNFMWIERLVQNC